MTDIFTQIDALLDDLRRTGQKAKKLRIGPDLREEFESQAGAAYVDGRYFDIPVTFDAIDPTSVVVDSEPNW